MHQFCLILGMLAACTAQAGFESAFKHVEPDARPWVYWYWMNGNIAVSYTHLTLPTILRV